MSWKRKVVWSEGMLLQPQHFQQHERHEAHSREVELHTSTPFAWGFSSLELDSAALSIGKVALASAKGIFPDGTPFEMPATESIPLALEISNQTRDQNILLAIPARRAGARESNNESDDALSRYRVDEVELSDSNTSGERSALIQVACLNARLMLQNEVTDAWTTLSIARLIERRSDNQIVLDKEHVPPSLDAHSAPVLKSYVSELVGLLQQRGDALAGRMSQTGSGGVSEVADFLLLQTVNRNEPLFRHLMTTSVLHPQRLFESCVALAGDLATFRDKRRVTEFERYIHDDLAKSFKPVMSDLRMSLSMVMEQSAFQIELHERKMGVRVGILSDAEMRKNATFVLTVAAQMPSDAVRARFPSQVKIGPVEKIRDLVNLQLPGVALSALPVAPRQIPFHTGACYFELDTKSSDLWRQLDKSGGLAVHVAGEFPGLELALWAIRS
jgi:type VI secretion system protein ImpJ